MDTTAAPDPADAVLWQPHEGWAEIVLNRPQRRNAIDGALADGLLAALARARADASLRALVLRGEGGAFCSGLDLKAFSAEPRPAWVAGFGTHWRSVHVALAESRTVLLVALERFAINGGAALALAGDLLVCGENAFLQVGEIRIGMPAPNNLAWLRMRHPEAVAARVALLGERLDAATLLRLGIATEVVTDDAVLPRCRALAAGIAGWPAGTVTAMKAALRHGTLPMGAARWFEMHAEPPPRPDTDPVLRT